MGELSRIIGGKRGAFALGLITFLRCHRDDELIGTFRQGDRDCEFFICRDCKSVGDHVAGLIFHGDRAVRVCDKDEIVIRLVGCRRGDNLVVRCHIGDRFLLRRGIISRIDQSQADVAVGGPEGSRSEEARVDILAVDLLQRLRVIILLCPDVSVRILVAHEVTGVVLLNLELEDGERIVERSRNRRGCVAEHVVGAGIHGRRRSLERPRRRLEVVINRLRTALTFKIRQIFGRDAGLFRDAETVLHRDLLGRRIVGDVSVRVRIVLDLGADRHVDVVPECPVLAVLADAVRRHEAEAFLAVREGPLIDRGRRGEREVLVCRDLCVVEGEAVGRIRNNFTAVADIVDRDRAVVILRVAALCAVGRRVGAEVSVCPLLLGIRGYLSGDGRLLRSLVAAECGDAESDLGAGCELFNHVRVLFRIRILRLKDRDLLAVLRDRIPLGLRYRIEVQGKLAGTLIHGVLDLRGFKRKREVHGRRIGSVLILLVRAHRLDR